MEVYLTAYQLLHFVAKAKKGDVVLVHAAASGIGTSVIQLCKKAGFVSIAVSSSNDKLEVCKQLVL